jgi:hypothetical protein
MGNKAVFSTLCLDDQNHFGNPQRVVSDIYIQSKEIILLGRGGIKRGILPPFARSDYSGKH